MNYKEIIKNISKNLRKLRLERKLTQEQVIELIGEENLSLRSYKTYESGNSETVPLLDKMTLLANFYGVSLDFLVLNKSSTYDDSFTKKDSLKRLGQLIFSLVLEPIQEVNQDNSNYGKYYFVANDKEVNMFINNYARIAEKNNYLYEYKNINNYDNKGMKDILSCINDIENLEENWYPTLSRFNSMLIEKGIEPDIYFLNHINKINKCRRCEQEKKK